MKLSSKIHLYSSVLMAAILIVMNLSVYYVFSKMTVDSQLEQAEAEDSKFRGKWPKPRIRFRRAIFYEAMSLWTGRFNCSGPMKAICPLQ